MIMYTLLSLVFGVLSVDIGQEQRLLAFEQVHVHIVIGHVVEVCSDSRLPLSYILLLGHQDHPCFLYVLPHPLALLLLIIDHLFSLLVLLVQFSNLFLQEAIFFLNRSNRCIQMVVLLLCSFIALIC